MRINETLNSLLKQTSIEANDLDKIDLKREFKDLYNPPSKNVVVVDVPCFNFLKIDGAGDPNTSLAYREAIEALYAVSYTLKFMIKKGKSAVDYGVMPLEGLWWPGDKSNMSMENKATWKWTAMIMQPKFVTEALFKESVQQVKKKRNPPALQKMRFEPLCEGLSAQIMHIGPWAAEKPTIENMHAFIVDNGYDFNGTHHEIYLGDPRKAAPEKLKTVVRQPIKKRT